MLKAINKVVKVLIFSDFFLNLGWGLISPIFAIFILENITKDPIEATTVAGFAALSYWITKSVLEIPIGRYLDKNDGERDDLVFMVAGTLITAIVPIGYLFSSEPWHIYFFQVIHAVGMAMSIPSWLAIFTRHIDKKKEAFEWSMETTSIGLGAGVAGGLGGVAVGMFGFDTIFIGVSLLTLLSALSLIFIKDSIFPRDKNVFVQPAKTVIEP